MEHCIARIAAIVAAGRDDRRAVLQLGYNLGRLSELSGLGREPFWDRWKGPVESWDQPELERLVRELQSIGPPPLQGPGSLEPPRALTPGQGHEPSSG